MAKTPNFAFELPAFDKAPWNQLINDNWSIIDAVMARFVAINNVKGVWQNATAVVVDDTYIDNVDGTLYRVLVAHTTASTGTFSADRAKNTANWILATTTVTDAGTWTAAKAYSANQFVVDGNRFGITTTAYTSSTTYDLDVAAGDIITLADLTTPVNAAATSATAAAVSAASVDLPTIVALNYLRGNSGASAFEMRTAAQVLSDIGAEAVDATLTALAGVTVGADTLIYATGTDAFTTTAFTAAARTLLDDTTVAAMRTTLGAQVDLAVPSQAEAEAGTATTERVWTSERVKQAIAALETDISQADQTAIEAETNENTYIPPDLLNFHPGIAKVWVKFDLAGTVNASRNVDSVTDTGTGDWTVVITTDFSGVDYCGVAVLRDDAGAQDQIVFTSAQAAGTLRIICVDMSGGILADPGAADDMHVACFGDQ